jgi:hypothetical protein
MAVGGDFLFPQSIIGGAIKDIESVRSTPESIKNCETDGVMISV